MHPKIASLLKPKALLVTIVALNIVPLVFMLFADKIMNVLLPSLFVILLPLFFMLYKSQANTPEFSFRPIKTLFSIIGLAMASLVTLFMIAYFSLSFQPLIADKGEVLWVALPGAENMAFVIRLFLQTWLFALVCMMAARWLKHQHHFSGFLLRFYEKKDMLPWLLDFVAIGGVIFVMSVLTILVSQQLYYFLSRLLGFENNFAFPQVTLFVFLFSIFTFNKATSFFKRVEKYAQSPKASMPKLYLIMIAFLVGTWIFSQCALLGLPEHFQLELSQALDTRYASLEKAARNWPTLVIGCSLFLVAPLSMLLSHHLQSRKAMWVAVVVPLALASFFLTIFPSINDAFWSWVPPLHFSTMPISDALAQFKFNGFSIVLMVLFIGLLSAMSNGGVWMRSMVEMSPDTLGRRERRVRHNFAKFFKPLCFILGVFSAFGMYGLALNAAAYIPTIITACGVLIILGLVQRYREGTASWQVFSKEG